MSAQKKVDLQDQEENLSAPEKTKTLVIIESSKKRALYSQNLSIYTGTEVFNKLNADEAIEFLKEQEDEIDLIVCKEKIGEENTALKVYYYVKSQELKVPFILIGHQSRLAGAVQMVDPESDWSEVIREAAKALKITSQRMILLNTDKYFPIDIKNFMYSLYCPVNIYQKGNIEDKEDFQLLFKEGQEIEKESIYQMIKNGSESLFVLSKERLKFTRSFSDQVLEALNNEESKEKMIRMTGALFSYSQSLVQKSGMDEVAVKVATQTINSMIKTSQKLKGIQNLFEIVAQNEESFIYNKSILISIIGHNLIEKMDWASKEFKHKLCFMAFFHDLTITDEKMCKIRTTAELEESELSEEEKKRVLNHAYEVVEILRSYPECPFGAEELILQHHGKKNGIGFADDNLNSEISPLSALFMVVESYVVLMLEGEDKNSALGSLMSKYTMIPYKKILLSLKELLED